MIPNFFLNSQWKYYFNKITHLNFIFFCNSENYYVIIPEIYLKIDKTIGSKVLFL